MFMFSYRIRGLRGTMVRPVRILPQNFFESTFLPPPSKPSGLCAVLGHLGLLPDFHLLVIALLAPDQTFGSVRFSSDPMQPNPRSVIRLISPIPLREDLRTLPPKGRLTGA